VWSDGGDEAFDEVRSWLIANGATVHEGLHSSNFQHGGSNVRGVSSTEEVQGNASLLAVPRHLWLTLSNFPEFRDAEFPPAYPCNQLASFEIRDVKLAAALASEAHKGEKSFFFKYIKNLPRMSDFQSFLPWMIRSSLKADFAALPLTAVVTKIQSDDREYIQKCCDRWIRAEKSPAKDLTWDEIQLGLAWIRTRSYTMFHYNNTLDAIALVPGADMLNVAKSSDLNTGWSSISADVFSIHSDGKPIDSGHELYESYCRQCDNNALMTSWGVYLEDNPNTLRHDSIDCNGPLGITMHRATELALQPRGGGRIPATWRSPRCRADIFDNEQGPLYCSLARLAWETCSSEWSISGRAALSFLSRRIKENPKNTDTGASLRHVAAATTTRVSHML
jgi:hypothetical protein